MSRVASRSVGLRYAGILGVFAMLLAATSGSAITYGTVDTEHRNVGSILVDYPEYGWIQWCSGTLVSARVFLTAGHCTFNLPSLGIGPDRMRVSFAVDLFAPGAKWHAVESYATHPDYAWTVLDFFGPTDDPRDVGVVVLKRSIPNLQPATLAPAGYLDGLRDEGSLKGARFAVVGYGVDQTFRNEGTRQIAWSEFLALLDAWLVMSQNVHTSDSGTCFGDSGGPTFFHDGTTEYLVAITSWGDAMCVASGFNYRIDTPASLDFIAEMVASAP